MKRALFFVVPFALAMVLSSVVRADDGEWTVTVGCQHCSFKDAHATTCVPAAKTADGKILVLKGDKVIAKEAYEKGGEYIVKGKIVDDGKAIEVTEMKKKA